MLWQIKLVPKFYFQTKNWPIIELSSNKKPIVVLAEIFIEKRVVNTRIKAKKMHPTYLEIRRGELSGLLSIGGALQHYCLYFSDLVQIWRAVNPGDLSIFSCLVFCLFGRSAWGKKTFGLTPFKGKCI